MKKLKKLSLEKEVIANLNDYQLKHINGGSSAVCGVTAVTAVSVAYSALTYNMYQSVAAYYSWVTAPNGRCEEDDIIYNGSVISEVVVYGSNACPTR